EIPDPYGPVPRPRDDAPAVLTDRHASDVAGMPLQHGDLSPAFEVPEPDGAILRTRDDKPSVGADRHAFHPAGMAGQHCFRSWSMDDSDPDGGAADGTRIDAVAVVALRHAEDGVFVALEDGFLLTGFGFPDADGPVLRTRDDALAVGADRHAEHRVHVPRQ